MSTARRRDGLDLRSAFTAGQVLECLAETLDVEPVLARFPGLTRERLQKLLRDAAESASSSPRIAPPAPSPPRGWPRELVAYVDGGARGNPGEAGAGVVIQDRHGTTLEQIAKYLGRATNNTAEYQALLIALIRARDAGATHLRVYSDSELMVNQVNGRYKTRQPHLQRFLQEAIRLIREIGRVDVSHVRREFNAAADALANQAIDEKL